VLSIVGDAVLSGLGVGSTYALIALGYTIILASSGVFNFAQGSVVMAGALVAYGLGTVAGWPVVATIAVVVGVGCLAGLLTHALSVYPLMRRRGATNLTGGTFLTTLGLGLAINAVIALAFGPETYASKTYVSGRALDVLSVNIQPIYIVMVSVVVVIMVAFEIFLRRTGFGVVMRATFADLEGASVAGIAVNRVVVRAFALGCALAALAGFLIVPITSASAGIAGSLSFYGFAAMAIGGYGSFMGAALGGFIVGLAQQVPVVWINPSASAVLIYAALVVILLIRPQGLFGSGGTAFGAAAVRDV
jgi:branched-subunit amino acid ABC-type transport system permease component